MDTTSVPSSLERLNFGFKVLLGYKVEVQVTTGVVYEGIFHAANYQPETDPAQHGVILKYARVIKDPSVSADKDAPAEKPAKIKRILASDLVQLLARDVRMNPEDLAGAQDDLETDAAISRGRGGAFGRDLQRWVPDEDDTGPMLSLDDSGLGWDQFAVNQQKFGVTTTYNEHLYTTVIDKDNCGISEEVASRIAREIETGAIGGSGLAAYHIAEERGFEIDDVAMNEEDRYGAVVRDPAPMTQDLRRPGGSGGFKGPQQQPMSATGPPPPPPPRAWGGMGAGVAAVAGSRAAMSISSGGGAGPAGGSSGGGSQNGSAGNSASQVMVPGQPLPGTATQAAAPVPGSWRSVAVNGSEDALRFKPTNNNRIASNALPIRVPNKLSVGPMGDRLPAVDALNLALPGPSSTPPELNRDFAKWKAEKASNERKAEIARTLEAFKKERDSSGTAATAVPQHVARSSSTAHTATPVVPALQPTPLATSITAAAGVAAAAGSQPAAGSAANAQPTSAAAASSTASATASSTAATSAADASASKKSGLNPNAKEFTLNISAKPFVPGGASSTPPPTASHSTPALPSATAVPGVTGPTSLSSFSGKMGSGAGGYVGPHAIPMHTPIGMHGALPHSLPHGDGHHHQGGADGTVAPVHVLHAPGGMRMAGLPSGAGMQGAQGASGSANDHMGPHGLSVAMGPTIQGMPVNPANGLPYVAMTPAAFQQAMQVGPGGQPMQISPGGMMSHGMQAVMFAQTPQGGPMRPGSLPTAGNPPVALMPVMQPGMQPGGMQPGIPGQGGMFPGTAMYAPLPQGGYTMMPLPGGQQLLPGMQALHMTPGAAAMAQGQGPIPGSSHVGSLGSQGGQDMHMHGPGSLRSQGSGTMKGMMGPGAGRGPGGAGGRGGPRGGHQGMDGHMGMQHMQHMGSMGGGQNMVMHVAHDGAKPPPPPPPPPVAMHHTSQE